MDWCTSEEGIELSFYNAYRDVVNGLKYALESALVKPLLTTKAHSVYIRLPGTRWAFPLIKDDSVVLTGVPDKKFWGLKISMNLPIPFSNEVALVALGTIPFPKRNLNELWHALVAPIDKAFPGSNYWLYHDEDDDDYHQGIEYDPQKFFYILGDSPSLVKDVGIIVFLIYALKTIGLMTVAYKFAEFCLVRYRELRTKLILYDLDDDIESTSKNVLYSIDQNSLSFDQVKDLINSLPDLTTNLAAVNARLDTQQISLTELNGKLNVISSSIGVRLLLK